MWVGDVVPDSWGTETFVTDAYHVVWVEGFDVCRCGVHPVCDNRGRAEGAAGFIGELPSEDGRGRIIPGDDGCNVLLVRGLRCGGGVPGRVADAIIRFISWHATIVTPVVHEVDYQADTVRFC